MSGRQRNVVLRPITKAAHVLLRLIRCVNGRVQAEAECCAPMFDYGRAPARWAYIGEGYHEAVAQAEGNALQLRLTIDLNVGFEATAATARTLLKEGDSQATLDHLSGYEGARPVRVGNAAYSQRQHDMWGAVVAAIDAYTRGHRRIEDRLWRIVQTQVECALEHWREPDQGIWEVRSGPQHFTFSKVACWVAADAGARIADPSARRSCSSPD